MSEPALTSLRVLQDVVIVGGGPSGLSAAIRLKQLSQESGYGGAPVEGRGFFLG